MPSNFVAVPRRHCRTTWASSIASKRQSTLPVVLSGQRWAKSDKLGVAVEAYESTCKELEELLTESGANTSAYRGTLRLGFLPCGRLAGLLRVDGDDQCVDRSLVHLSRGIVLYGRERGVALLVDEPGSVGGENRLLDLVKGARRRGVTAFEADQVIAEGRSNRLAHVVYILERERRVGEGRVHLRLVEIIDVAAIALRARVIGNLLGESVEVGAGEDFGARFLRQLQCLFRRVLLGVEQDVRCGNLFGHAILVAIGEIKLPRPRLESRPAGIEGTPRFFFDSRDLQPGVYSINLERKAHFHLRVLVQSRCARLG